MSLSFEQIAPNLHAFRSRLLDAAEQFQQIGDAFSRIGLMFKDVAHVKDLNDRIITASHRFRELADLEEQTCTFLEDQI